MPRQDDKPPAARLRRPLSADEQNLWSRVAATARPLRGKLAVPSISAPAPPPQAEAEPPKAQAPSANTLKAEPNAAAPRPLRPQDRSHEKRVAKGTVTPAARLDLHGLTRSQAHHALLSFVTASAARKRACVLVITGKGGFGRETGAYDGVLRRDLPLWLESPSFSGLVAGFAIAHRRHGGEGAFYLFLRFRPSYSSPDR